MFIRKQVLQQHYTEQPDLDNISNIIDFSRDGNNSISSKFKLERKRQAGNGDTKIMIKWHHQNI